VATDDIKINFLLMFNIWHLHKTGRKIVLCGCEDFLGGKDSTATKTVGSLKCCVVKQLQIICSSINIIF
jgi:hypothetical protein